jgi:hypothetical protein
VNDKLRVLSGRAKPTPSSLRQSRR